MSSSRDGAEPDKVLEEVSNLLGREAASSTGGGVVARPTSDEEVAALLRLAAERGWKVRPSGGSVGADLLPLRESSPGRSAAGLPEPDLVISTLAMREVLEYEPADLTVRMRAGISLGSLQAAVSEEGQWLALDPPGGEDVTLGGVVATGTSGPLRVQYGRPRDQVLGLTVVDGSGRVLALGGKVVKNVAGFDLVRLATGSCGSLGVVTEVTMRLYPAPEADRTLVWSREGLEEGWELGRRLASLPLPLSAAELIAGRWDAPLDGDGCRVVLRLNGTGAAVARMREQLVAEGGELLRELTGDESRRAFGSIARGDGLGETAFRAHTLPDRGRHLLPVLSELPLERLALHLLQGTFRGSLSSGREPRSLSGLTDPVRKVRGTLRFLRASGGVPAGVETGTEPGPMEVELQRKILSGFDPAGTLPGSWLEGWT
jgi:FAD/FMN-containing dehydrogenase